VLPDFTAAALDLLEAVESAEPPVCSDVWEKATALSTVIQNWKGKL
jgi:hypothetical protein